MYLLVYAFLNLVTLNKKVTKTYFKLFIYLNSVLKNAITKNRVINVKINVFLKKFLVKSKTGIMLILKKTYSVQAESIQTSIDSYSVTKQMFLMLLHILICIKKNITTLTISKKEFKKQNV